MLDTIVLFALGLCLISLTGFLLGFLYSIIIDIKAGNKLAELKYLEKKQELIAKYGKEIFEDEQ